MSSPPAPPAPDDEPAPVQRGDGAPADGAPADDAGPPARRLGEGIDERPIPRGCNPLVFGVVMGTIQFVISIYFMRTC